MVVDMGERLNRKGQLSLNLKINSKPRESQQIHWVGPKQDLKSHWHSCSKLAAKTWIHLKTLDFSSPVEWTSTAAKNRHYFPLSNVLSASMYLLAAFSSFFSIFFTPCNLREHPKVAVSEIYMRFFSFSSAYLCAQCSVFCRCSTSSPFIRLPVCIVQYLIFGKIKETNEEFPSCAEFHSIWFHSPEFNLCVLEIIRLFFHYSQFHFIFLCGICARRIEKLEGEKRNEQQRIYDDIRSSIFIVFCTVILTGSGLKSLFLSSRLLFFTTLKINMSLIRLALCVLYRALMLDCCRWHKMLEFTCRLLIFTIY